MTANDKQARLATASAVVNLFAPEATLELRRGKVWVSWWSGWKRSQITVPWQAVSPGSFFPVWSRKWGHGGTCCTALAQLVSWIQGRPVLPLSTWRYWVGEQVALGRLPEGDRGPEIVATLEAGGYPVEATCIFCGKSPIGRFDWYTHGKVRGPGCKPRCEDKQVATGAA